MSKPPQVVMYTVVSRRYPPKPDPRLPPPHWIEWNFAAPLFYGREEARNTIKHRRKWSRYFADIDQTEYGPTVYRIVEVNVPHNPLGKAFFR